MSDTIKPIPRHNQGCKKGKGCRHCEGRGWYLYGFEAFYIIYSECESCNGTGKHL